MIRLFIIVGSLVFILCSCNITNSVSELSETATAYINNSKVSNYLKNKEMLRQDVAFDSDTAKANARAKIITTAVSQLDEVNMATSAVNGSAAIVGVELNEKTQLTDKQLIALKNKIISLVKAVDPQIKTVAVTAHPTVMGKLNRLSFFRVPQEGEVNGAIH